MNALTRRSLASLRLTLPRILSAAYSVNTGSKEHLDGLVRADKVVVFMKGIPSAPRCGFSNAVMQILDFHGVDKFTAHNVLDDEDLRQGIKEFSNWPTIPQVYFGGEFLGGSDIMIEMHQNGELIEELEKLGIRSALLDNPDKKV